MLESYQISSSTDKILSRFSLSLNEYTNPIKSACTIVKGTKGYVFTSESDRELRRMKFGFTPHWAKTPMDILTARAEGDKNLDNDPYYNGPNSIFLKPAFKKAIQHYRCLVVADSYVENSSKQQQLIRFPENNFPIVFAGIYDYWTDPDTKTISPGFAIITVPASEMLQQIGIKRMPLVLSFYNCTNWVKPQKPLNYYLPMLNRESAELVNVISLKDLGKTGKQEQSNIKTEQSSEPLPKRYYNKRQLHTPYDNSTMGERIERERLLNS
jgi:putative SOS response-associated peptidase YedK